MVSLFDQSCVGVHPRAMKWIFAVSMATGLASASAWATLVMPTVVALTGHVQILTKTGAGLPSMLYEGEKLFYREARIGMQIPDGAIVWCPNEAKAKLVYPSGTSLWIAPGSMVKIVKVEQEPVGESSILNVMYGRLRSLVTKSPKAKWQVYTPSAVEGVRGTDFVTGYSPVTGHEVSVISGVVDVKPLKQEAPAQPVKQDQTAHETAPGKIELKPISTVAVLSAYELTVIPAPAKEAEPPPEQVKQLETKSSQLVREEVRESVPEVYKSFADPEKTPAEDLQRALTEKHIHSAKPANGATPGKKFDQDLNNYKKYMDKDQ
jgi:hypothetical protein